MLFHGFIISLENEIHAEMTVVEGKSLLPRLKQKSLAQLQQEVLEPVDNRRFQFAL